MTPARTVAPALVWGRHHLYQEWPSGRRRYVGSIVRSGCPHHRTWSVWRRGEYIASYSDESGAREGLEECIREEG